MAGKPSESLGRVAYVNARLVDPALGSAKQRHIRHNILMSI